MSSKIYTYDKLSYTGDENEEIIFKVKMISNGNDGKTIIDLPNDDEKVIPNSGKESLGTLKNLTRVKTKSYTNVNNLNPDSDSIIVEFYINSKLMVRHENLKSESEDPFIILKIKFEKS